MLPRAGTDPTPICLANPEVIAASDDVSIFEEGCLSLPEQFANVKRPKSVCVRYRDYENKICEQEMNGFLATCVQHEIDHLNGVLFVDHISSLKRGMLLRKLIKIKNPRPTRGPEEVNASCFHGHPGVLSACVVCPD